MLYGLAVAAAFLFGQCRTLRMQLTFDFGAPIWKTHAFARRWSPVCPSVRGEFRSDARRGNVVAVPNPAALNIAAMCILKCDNYLEVSSRVFEELEAGAAPWVKPWAATAGQNVPQNAVTNRPSSASSARSDFSGLRIRTPYALAASSRAGRRLSYLAFGGGAGAVGRAQVWGRAQRPAVATALIGSEAKAFRACELDCPAPAPAAGQHRRQSKVAWSSRGPIAQRRCALYRLPS